VGLDQSKDILGLSPFKEKLTPQISFLTGLMITKKAAREQLLNKLNNFILFFLAA
jgi:hypothetical protein